MRLANNYFYTALLIIVCLLIQTKSFSQDLNFSSTAPVYPAGATSNSYTGIGSPAVNVDVSVSGGSFTNNTPKPVSTGLQTTLNFADPSETRTYTFTFGDPVTGLSFDLRALQYNTSNASQSRHYQDKIILLATDAAGNSVPLPLSSGNGYSVNGNEILATSTTATNVSINFPSAVKTLTIIYGNGPLAGSNPGAQGFTIGHMSWTGSVLPVELMYFRGQSVGSTVQLLWETAWERNSSHFVVEHSLDLMEFIPIGQVKAAGEATRRQTYSFVDELSHQTTNYYRLRQVDKDGSVEYSKTIAVRHNGNVPAITVYPNPTDGERIYLQLGEVDVATLQLTDLTGRPIAFELITAADKKVILTPKIPLRSGLYLLRAPGISPVRLLVR